MRILVTGGQGQLARAIKSTWPVTTDEVLLMGRDQLDLGDPSSIRKALEGAKPDVILNAGAHTQVDRCESEPDLALRLNGAAVGELASWCSDRGALLVQVSTDYVFDGKGHRPYREEDPTDPLTVYGRTKLEGERQATRAPEHLIVRTSWLYEAWGKNFLATMLNAAAQGRSLRVVADQRGTPTSCRALARQLRCAIHEGWRGVVHGSCSGETTWHGFAAEIFRQKGLSPVLSPCTTAEYPLPAPRPAYSVLSGEKRARMGTDVMPEWKEGLAEVLMALS
ncbi:MAG: dTDP-4-dehydrorhamnose reductase [Acidobacteria bacterium]|nr:dTDP-4-dehydrorhamnose reductase [Acidobacteriota bacterium]